jgi:hypothetical protein
MADGNVEESKPAVKPAAPVAAPAVSAAPSFKQESLPPKPMPQPSAPAPVARDTREGSRDGPLPPVGGRADIPPAGRLDDGLVFVIQSLSSFAGHAIQLAMYPSARHSQLASKRIHSSVPPRSFNPE